MKLRASYSYTAAAPYLCAVYDFNRCFGTRGNTYHAAFVRGYGLQPFGNGKKQLYSRDGEEAVVSGGYFNSNSLLFIKHCTVHIRSKYNAFFSVQKQRYQKGKNRGAYENVNERPAYWRGQVQRKHNAQPDRKKVHKYF